MRRSLAGVVVMIDIQKEERQVLGTLDGDKKWKEVSNPS
jgi:hypothetical protein